MNRKNQTFNPALPLAAARKILEQQPQLPQQSPASRAKAKQIVLAPPATDPALRERPALLAQLIEGHEARRAACAPDMFGMKPSDPRVEHIAQIEVLKFTNVRSALIVAVDCHGNVLAEKEIW